jgi:hypothetical protein
MLRIQAKARDTSQSLRQDSSNPAHVWSKLVLIISHPLSKAKETFYNSNFKYFEIFLGCFVMYIVNSTPVFGMN